jgi:hypothetical protein
LPNLSTRPRRPLAQNRVDGRVCPTAVRHEMCLNRRTALILLDSRRLRINCTRKGVNAVRHQNSVFHGLLKHVPWATLARLVEEHEAGRDPRSLQARAHLVAMLYAQFSGSRSLRDIETSLKSQVGRLYHLGGAPVRGRPSPQPTRHGLAKPSPACLRR